MRRNALHLFVLSAFAIAQPLFAKLGPAPGYFAAHEVTGPGLVGFAVVALVVPPLVLLVVEGAAALASRRLAGALHLAFVAGLVALIVVPALGGLATAAACALALVIGVAFAAVYARARIARAFVTAALLGPLLFGVAFLGFSSAGEVVLRGQDAPPGEGLDRPPVVFIQLDALSSLMLETGDRRIDAVRYPTFARLAREGAWYRNASNVHENTVFSVSSILDGQLPRKGTKPVVQDHPQNLFTLLGPTYDMNVAEEATTLCPYEFCSEAATEPVSGSVRRLWEDTRVVFNHIVRPEDARDSLPPLQGRWSDFGDGPRQTDFETKKKTPGYVIRHLRSGRIGRFERWLEKVGRQTSRPALDYIHIFLPHEPREFLPDGRRYPIPDSGLESPPSYDKPFLAQQGQQRLLLQLGYTDRLIGRVIERLEESGAYDGALIVIVADHGESFDVKPTPAGPFVPGRLGFRRAVTRDNIEDIASVPLFVKYPKGRGPTGTDTRFVRTVDILPTVAGVLGLKIARVAGSDLRDRGYRGHSEIAVGTTFEEPVRMRAGDWQRRREESLRRRLALFGSGRDDLFRWGGSAGLVGRDTREFVIDTGPRVVRADVDDASRLRRVDPDSAVCPCLLAGRLIGAPPGGITVAVAVNGRIEASVETYAGVGEKQLNWSALVRPEAFRAGRNVVEVFRSEGNRLTPLARVP